MAVQMRFWRWNSRKAKQADRHSLRRVMIKSPLPALSRNLFKDCGIMAKSFDCFVGSMKIHTHVVFPIPRHDRQFRTIEIQIDVYVGTVGHPCLPSAETVPLHRARRARVNAGQSLEQSAFQLALLPPPPNTTRDSSMTTAESFHRRIKPPLGCSSGDHSSSAQTACRFAPTSSARRDPQEVSSSHLLSRRRALTSPIAEGKFLQPRSWCHARKDGTHRN